MLGLDVLTVENVLFATAYILAFMFIGQVSWLVARRWSERAKRARLDRLDKTYSGHLLDLLDANDVKHAAHVLRDVPRSDLRDWLTAIAARTTGEYLSRIRKLYRQVGLADADLHRFRAGRVLPQLVTARRLVLMGPDRLSSVADPRFEPKSHGARLLMLMAFGPSDSVASLIPQLRSWPPVDELQGHALRNVLRTLSPDQHAELMAHWSEIHQPTVQAIVLREACMQLPDRQDPWLKTAFASTHPVLRKTACIICRDIGRIDQAIKVIAAASDPDPTVRAAAVGYLGRLKIESGRDVLIHALQDSDYIVRVYAGFALFHLGGSSREQLQWSRQLHPDPNARDVAAMVLDQVGPEAA